MTPEEARDLLEGTTPGPWFFDDDMAGTVYTIGPIVSAGTELDCSTDDAALAAHAPDMAAMIAGIRPEYAVQVRRAGEWQYSRDEDDFRWLGLGAQVFIADRDHPDEENRIVRRYVTEPEEP